MNPHHRDPNRFVRVGSGEFKKGLDVTLARTDKPIRLNNATEFMSSERVQVSDAVAGDIVAYTILVIFKLVTVFMLVSARLFIHHYQNLPPEYMERVTAKNVMKQKSFHKGMNQLVQEVQFSFTPIIKRMSIFLVLLVNCSLKCSNSE